MSPIQPTRFLSLALLAAAAGAAQAAGTPPAGTRWRLDGEASCTTGEISVLHQGPLAGGGEALLSKDSQFARAHEGQTATEGRWLHQLEGTAGPVRAFSMGGLQVLVVAICPAAGCTGNAMREHALVAYEPRSGGYGASVWEGPLRREILAGRAAGQEVHPAPIRAALQCAIQADS